MQITTTLNQLKAHNACAGGYKKLAKSLGGIRKYGKDTPITFQQIYNSNGYDDTLWALRAVDEKYYPLWRHFAVDCAKQVEHLMEDERSTNALIVARLHADGLATNEELDSAWASARDSAWDSAWASARASAWDSAWASARASARASAWASARDSAWASARASARASAWASARASQIKLLFVYCEKGNRPEDSVEMLQKFMQEGKE